MNKESIIVSPGGIYVQLQRTIEVIARRTDQVRDGGVDLESILIVSMRATREQKIELEQEPMKFMGIFAIIVIR